MIIDFYFLLFDNFLLSYNTFLENLAIDLCFREVVLAADKDGTGQLTIQVRVTNIPAQLFRKKGNFP